MDMKILGEEDPDMLRSMAHLARTSSDLAK